MKSLIPSRAPASLPGATPSNQAVLAAASQLEGPFVVANADDFYGRGAFRALTAHFASPERAGEREGRHCANSPMQGLPGNRSRALLRCVNSR